MFRALNVEELKEIDAMCAPEQFEAGEIICKQDTQIKKMYVIEEGLVAIILEIGPLSHRQVQAASNFEAVGWSAVIDPYISTSTIKALERTKVLAFKGEDLTELCLHRPEIGCRVSRGLARIIAARLRNAYTQLLGVTSQD